MHISDFILGWVVLVLIANTIAMLIKEPAQETDSENQATKLPFFSKQLFGYISAFLPPVNCLISILVVYISGALLDGNSGDFAPPPSVGVGFLCFICLFVLGNILGIIGVIIIPSEEKTRRYRIISWVGLLSHIIPLVIILTLKTILGGV